jgi:6-phosphogluconolactonase
LRFNRQSHWQYGVFTLLCVWLLASCHDANSPQVPVATVSTPNVVGMTQAAATSTLTGAKLVVGSVTMQSSTSAPVGTVISQSIAPGVIVSPGTSINLAVSSGPVSVPNVVGLTQPAATTALASAGLTVGTVTPASSATLSPGSIISQSPAAGSVTVSGSAVNLTISVGPAASYAYVAGSGAISAYSINAGGQLAPLAGSPIPIPGSGQLYETKIDPSGHFLYAVNNDLAGGVFAFSIAGGSGSLVPLNGGLPYPTGASPQSLAFDATGGFLYVLNLTDNSISSFSLDPATGALTPLTTYPITAANPNPEPRQMARAGNFLYLAEYANNSVEVFAIAGTGGLTQGVAGSPFATDSGPFSLAIDPSGSVLYTANLGATAGGSVSAFTVNSSSGVLTPASVRPLAIPVYNYISIDPQGKFLFVTEANAVAVYPITQSTGMLGAAVPGPAFAAGSFPYSVSVDLTGQFAYVANDGAASVSQFMLDSDTGVLTPMQGSPVAAGSDPVFIAIF